MVEVTTAEAKARLSELLRRAEAGETIAITRYGKVIATLNPAKHAAPDLSDFRAEQGQVTGSALAALLTMRDEERY